MLGCLQEITKHLGAGRVWEKLCFEWCSHMLVVMMWIFFVNIKEECFG